jgi:hypothetical protein
MANVDLGLQDPGAASGYLLEEIVAASESASRGGGIFAFATARGIRTVLEDQALSRLLSKGAFDLVVGVDSVTDIPALDTLLAASKRHHGLRARALVHTEQVLFHPKLSWFVGPSGITVLVGSGNLTARGLKENWEAFAKVQAVGTHASRLEAQIVAWLTRHDHLLLSPEDPDARAEAQRNTGNERSLKHPKAVATKQAPPTTAEVLVAEAPKSGTRPSQVNFHLEFYEGFFRAKPGTGRRILLHAVMSHRAVAEGESRPSSSRKSKNYSLELNAFKTPASSRAGSPIGLYLRLPQGTFLYQRVGPGEAGYAQLASFLSNRWSGPSRQKRQVVAGLLDVQKAWPGSPLWHAEVPSS